MVGISHRHGVLGHELAFRIVALDATAFVQRRPVAALCIHGRAVGPAAIGRRGLELRQTPADSRRPPRPHRSRID